MDDITIKASTLKKVLYFIPYIILIGIIIFQFSYPNCPTCENSIDQNLSQTSQSKNTQETLKSDINSKNSTQENIELNVEETQEEEVIEETPKETQENECIKTSETGFDISIKKITTYKVSDTFAKITKVKYTIKNGKEDFSPVVEFQIQNDDSTREIEHIEIKKGCEETFEKILPNKGLSYTDITDDKVLILSLYKGSNVVDSTTAKFTTN